MASSQRLSYSDSLPAERSSDTRAECATSASMGAATIDGSYEISEQQVSDYIEQYRVFNDLKDDNAWATYLDQSGATAESVRTDAIDYYATRYAVEQKCKEDGITASDDDVQQQIDKV